MPNPATEGVVNVWKVAPGEHAWVWQECLDSGCITINWMNDRNFNDFDTEADIRRALAKKKDGHGGAPYIWSFVNRIQPGHVVVANNGLSRVEGIGRVTSAYLHPKHPKNPRRNESYHLHARLVKWLVKDAVDLSRKLFIQPTVEPLDSEQCHIIKQTYLKQTYLKQYPKYKDTLDKIFPLSADSQFDQSEDVAEIMKNGSLRPTTKKALIDARRGQGAFRQSVLKQWRQRCAVSSSAIVEVIRASHIKSWKESTNDERLDPENGLPLIANLDALFDAGLISFDPSGVMLMSPRLNAAEQKVFSLHSSALTRPPTARMAEYLAYHRRKHGFS